MLVSYVIALTNGISDTAPERDYNVVFRYMIKSPASNINIMYPDGWRFIRTEIWLA